MAELCQPDSKLCIGDFVYAVTFKHVELKLYAAAVYVPDKQVYCTATHEQLQCIELRNNLTDEYDSNSEVALLIQSLTVESPVQLECTDGDVNIRSCSYGSVSGDIDTRSRNFTTDFQSDMHNNNISEVLDYIYRRIHSVEQQTITEEQVRTTKLKTYIGKAFTEFLVHLCILLLKAIDDETVNLVKSSTENKQYIIRELAASTTILMTIMEKFCKEQNNDFIQYALLPIVLTRANRIAMIIRNISQPFWKRLSSHNMNALLSMYDKITQVVKWIEDIDHRPFCKLLGDIQQLKACLDNVDTISQRMFNSQLTLCISLGADETICFIVKTADHE